jgi:competence protein ComEA
MMKRLIATTVLAAFSACAFATVNVNTAQQSELQRTKGLDKQKAKAIIEYRAQNGAIASLEDLEKIPGFSHEVVARVAPEIAFTGDPYVPAKPASAKDKEKEKPKK